MSPPVTSTPFAHRASAAWEVLVLGATTALTLGLYIGCGVWDRLLGHHRPDEDEALAVNADLPDELPMPPPRGRSRILTAPQRLRV